VRRSGSGKLIAGNGDPAPRPDTYFYALEGDLECWLLNAQHLRNVPGRKTDVADAAWICQLVEHGLVRPSFVPPNPIRALRDLTRYRKSQIEERTREVQRLDKVLQDAGIKAHERGVRDSRDLRARDAR
jgi:transposase